MNPRHSWRGECQPVKRQALSQVRLFHPRGHGAPKEVQGGVPVQQEKQVLRKRRPAPGGKKGQSPLSAGRAVYYSKRPRAEPAASGSKLRSLSASGAFKPYKARVGSPDSVTAILTSPTPGRAPMGRSPTRRGRPLKTISSVHAALMRDDNLLSPEMGKDNVANGLVQLSVLTQHAPLAKAQLRDGMLPAIVAPPSSPRSELLFRRK